ncbi:MAG: hypothetical protein EP338_02245 [Bacteroidetes bacterium]|nr:MAG: hypothetical protein EP338_02245 [Bacteroidota bacterium]
MKQVVKLTGAKHLDQLELIQALRGLLQGEYASLFHCVAVHGSVATDEIIPFSDFDGLLILRSGKENSPELQQFLRKSMKIIYEFDPLQHHSWFQIKEEQLHHYPQSYFPIELLQECALILPEDDCSLEINPEQSTDYGQNFLALHQSLSNKIHRKFIPANKYQLKSVLSEILLLPCFFLQAYLEKGVLKKESFELIRTYFNPEELQPLHLASEMRLRWERPALSSFQKYFLEHPQKKLHKMGEKWFAPALNKQEKEIFNHDFMQELKKMIDCMKFKLIEDGKL